MKPEQVCIEVRSVNKDYGNKRVLEDVSINVKEAEIYGLLGPSGAGKTTLVKCIAGIEEVNEGLIYMFKEKMPKLELMKDIGYMTQSDALYQDLSAYENLDFFGSIYGLKGKKKKQRIREVMELVGLDDELKKVVSNYSGGMKRRLSLGIALLHEPQIIILDEPTIGVDPVLRNSIWKELHRLSEQGKTIIVTTHVMDEADRCDRLGMLRNGELIAEGSPKELKESVNTSSLEEVFLTYGRNRQ